MLYDSEFKYQNSNNLLTCACNFEHYFLDNVKSPLRALMFLFTSLPPQGKCCFCNNVLFSQSFFFFLLSSPILYGLCNCHDCILLIGREVKLETTWTNCTLAKEEVKHIILYYLMHRTKLLMTNFSLRIIGNYTVHFPEIKIK